MLQSASNYVGIVGVDIETIRDLECLDQVDVGKPNWNLMVGLNGTIGLAQR